RGTPPVRNCLGGILGLHSARTAALAETGNHAASATLAPSATATRASPFPHQSPPPSSSLHPAASHGHEDLPPRPAQRPHSAQDRRPHQRPVGGGRQPL